MGFGRRETSSLFIIIMESELRRTGKTTGLLLEALGKAMQNPGQEVKFVDHAVTTTQALGYHKDMLKGLIDRMNLQDIEVIQRQGYLSIKSHHKGMYYPPLPNSIVYILDEEPEA